MQIRAKYTKWMVQPYQPVRLLILLRQSVLQYEHTYSTAIRTGIILTCLPKNLFFVISWECGEVLAHLSLEGEPENADLISPHALQGRNL